MQAAAMTKTMRPIWNEIHKVLICNQDIIFYVLIQNLKEIFFFSFLHFTLILIERLRNDKLLFPTSDYDAASIVSLIRIMKLFIESAFVSLLSPWNTPKYTPKPTANATINAIPIIQNNKLSAQLQQLKSKWTKY